MILDTKTRRTLTGRAGIVGLTLAAVLLLPLAVARPVPADSIPAKTAAMTHAKSAEPPLSASRLLTRAKDRASEQSLIGAETADPTNAKWPGQLAFLYRLNVADDGTPTSRTLARASLAQYERATFLAEQGMVKTRHVPPFRGEPVSEMIARMAFAAGDYSRAKHCSVALLQVGQTQGQSMMDQSENVHVANLVLGRLALHDGQTAQAEQYLLAMGRIPGSPSQKVSGPNMRLAKELLAAGRRDTVLAYFDECAKFWNDPQLAEWRSEVTQGKMPHFNANLYY